jgi:hypothetical protein
MIPIFLSRNVTALNEKGKSPSMRACTTAHPTQGKLMKTLATLITAVLLTLASASAAEARSPNPMTSVRVNFASVQLTPGEVQFLRSEKAQLQRYKIKAMRNGSLSRQERLQLRAMNKAFATKVRTLKHNRARRL